MTVLLALAAAAGYGLSDFLGGLFSRRREVWPVGVLACTGAFLAALGLAVTVPGDPRPADFGWALLAGLGGGVGTSFLYRGLAGGRMGLVAPVSGVGSALIPLMAGLLGGDRPGAWAWAGIALAFPGIWLVSREHEAAAGRGGLADGVLAGAGFGLVFAALGQIPDSSGYWPLTLAQGCAVLVVAVVAVAFGENPLPRRGSDLWGLVPGLLAGLAMLLFLVAASHGLLSVAAVVSSLYPAFTVLLAVALLGEHVHRGQAAGLVLCVGTIVLVGVG